MAKTHRATRKKNTSINAKWKNECNKATLIHGEQHTTQTTKAIGSLWIEICTENVQKTRYTEIAQAKEENDRKRENEKENRLKFLVPCFSIFPIMNFYHRKTHRPNEYLWAALCLHFTKSLTVFDFCLWFYLSQLMVQSDFFLFFLNFSHCLFLKKSLSTLVISFESVGMCRICHHHQYLDRFSKKERLHFKQKKISMTTNACLLNTVEIVWTPIWHFFHQSAKKAS